MGKGQEFKKKYYSWTLQIGYKQEMKFREMLFYFIFKYCSSCALIVNWKSTRLIINYFA